MSDDTGNFRSDPEKELDRLVRAAGDADSRSFSRPADEVIQAYLMGTASRKQKKIMRAALLASSEFRAEVLEMAGDLETISKPETSDRIEDVVVEYVPDFSYVLPRPVVRRSLWERLAPYFTVPRLATVAAVAALAVFVTIQIDRRDPEWELAADDVEFDFRIAAASRFVGPPDSTRKFSSAKQAVLNAFASTLDLEESGRLAPRMEAEISTLPVVYSPGQKRVEAENLFRQTIEKRERILGNNHPLVATGLHGYAQFLAGQRDLAAARPLFERSLEIRETALAPDDADLATSLQSLAGVYNGLGMTVEAAPLADRAFAILASRPPDSPTVVREDGRTLRIRVVTEDEEVLTEVTAAIPEAMAANVEELEAWLVSMTTRELQKLDMEDDTVSVAPAEGFGGPGFLAFTYKDDGGYHFILGSAYLD